MKKSNAPTIFIGVCGGSGSGKTTLAQKIKQSIEEQWTPSLGVAILGLDHYYHDQSAHFDGDGGSVNFDHPDSLDFELFLRHLKALKEGAAIERPIYDYATHSRQPHTVPFPGHRIVILDGILLYHHDEVQELIDMKIFLDIDEETRVERRLARDQRERSRTLEGIKAQMENQVLPMHRKFVDPSKFKAHKVLEENHQDEIIIKDLLKWLSALTDK